MMRRCVRNTSGRSGVRRSAARHTIGGRSADGSRDRSAALRTVERLSLRGLGRSTTVRGPGADEPSDQAVISFEHRGQQRRKRFIDEGADYRNYTYAGGADPASAWSPRLPALRRQDQPSAPAGRVHSPGVSRHEASTIVELADKIGINPRSLERTVEEYNAATQPGEFNPAVKDGKRTEGIEPPKSNWALPLDAPPFLAFSHLRQHSPSADCI